MTPDNDAAKPATDFAKFVWTCTCGKRNAGVLHECGQCGRLKPVMITPEQAADLDLPTRLEFAFTGRYQLDPRDVLHAANRIRADAAEHQSLLAQLAVEQQARKNVQAELEQARASAAVVCKLLELGDNRLLASDGPVDGQLPQLSPDEWGEVYGALTQVGLSAQPLLAELTELRAPRDSKEHDPYNDLISSNQESILTILREGITRAKNAIDAGQPEHARALLSHAGKFHPMYDFSEWPTGPLRASLPEKAKAAAEEWCKKHETALYREMLPKLAAIILRHFQPVTSA